MWSVKICGTDHVWEKGKIELKKIMMILTIWLCLFRNKNADDLTQSEIDDLIENVQKSTELQNLLAEKFQMEGQIIPFVIFSPCAEGHPRQN